MTNFTNTIGKLAIAASLSLAMFTSTGASAITTPMTANIAFETPVTLQKINDINFGTVSALNASTYKITTAGVVSTTTGTGVSLFGTKAAGNIKVMGSSSATVSINVNNYQANNGVTPSAATCSYNGGAEAACTTLTSNAAPTAAGKTLLVGVTVQANGTQNAGSTAAPTFDVVVNYT